MAKSVSNGAGEGARLPSKLKLDLSQSRAKVARARIHLESLLRNIHDPAGPIYKDTAYAIRVSQIDKNGWCFIALTPRKLGKHELGVIVGDLVHCLRSALDYIVAALAKKSKAKRTEKHQFPIFTSEIRYNKRAGDKSSAVPSGCISGVKIGLALLHGVQPFHRKKNSFSHPLNILRELSNSDKHHIVAASIPHAIESRITVLNGTVLEHRNSLTEANWKPNRKREIFRVRFAPPFPAKPEIKTEVTVMVQFTTDTLAKRVLRDPIRPDTLNAIIDEVEEIIARFEAL
ncbi:MAG: hypothetical protein ACYC8W_03800 [Candidatus Tyrphobacter sp.]